MSYIDAGSPINVDFLIILFLSFWFHRWKWISGATLTRVQRVEWVDQPIISHDWVFDSKLRLWWWIDDAYGA